MSIWFCLWPFHIHILITPCLFTRIVRKRVTASCCCVIPQNGKIQFVSSSNEMLTTSKLYWPIQREKKNSIYFGWFYRYIDWLSFMLIFLSSILRKPANVCIWFYFTSPHHFCLKYHNMAFGGPKKSYQQVFFYNKNIFFKYILWMILMPHFTNFC